MLFDAARYIACSRFRRRQARWARSHDTPRAGPHDDVISGYAAMRPGVIAEIRRSAGACFMHAHWPELLPAAALILSILYGYHAQVFPAQIISPTMLLPL